MTKEQLEAILGDSPLSPEVKQEIMTAQANGAGADQLVQLIESRLIEVAEKLNAEDPKTAAEFAKMEEEYVKEVTAADQEFNTEMAAIESELKTLENALGKDLDNVRLDELKEDIQNIAK